MDKILVHLLLLDEFQIVALAGGLAIAGGGLGALFLKVRIPLRRVGYLWFLAGLNLARAIAQMGWLYLPPATEAGFFSALLIGLYGSFLLFGVGVYYASAARSNDICGRARMAWMGFVPLVNLVLVFRRGGAMNAETGDRPGLPRYVYDPLLVIGALAVFSLSQRLVDDAMDTPPWQPGDSPALEKLFVSTRTLEQSFAIEAEASSQTLPLRIDEITVLTAMRAEGDTLYMTFEIEDDTITGLNPEFEPLIAEWQCTPDTFATDLARGGRIMSIYKGADGQVIAEYEITQEDCDTAI